MKWLALIVKLGLDYFFGERAGVAKQQAADVKANTVALKDRADVDAKVDGLSDADVDVRLSKWVR